MMYAADIKMDVFGDLLPAIERASTRFMTLALRYPLHCVSRNDAAATEDQFVGPFATHDDAHEQLRDRSDVVRRCRQLRPSEIVVDYIDVIGLPLDELIETLDEIATSTRSGLPECAWYSGEGQIVFVDGDDGTLPISANYVEWVDTHLRVDAYICEGDE